MGAKDQGADNSSTAMRWQVVPRTLCFVTHGEDLLLMKRAPHKRVYPGYYNGVGGHIERNEDPQTGAIREIKEETGLNVTNVRYCGTTHIDAGHKQGIILFIYTAEATHRNFRNSDEGSLEWIPIYRVLAASLQPDETLPLVEDLPILLPRIFDPNSSQSPFFAHVSYDQDDTLLLQFAPNL